MSHHHRASNSPRQTNHASRTDFFNTIHQKQSFIRSSIARLYFDSGPVEPILNYNISSATERGAAAARQMSVCWE
jgi:hypothetical protein